MSSDETQSALSRAFDLVEAGNYAEARAILEPILASDKDNADAWWIYAHAVTDPNAGRDALENVVRIDPQYPDAAELLAQAQEELPPKPKITGLVRPISAPEAPAHLPELPPEPANAAQPTSAGKQASTRARAERRSTLPLIAIFVVIIIVAAAVILLLAQNGQTPPATPTANVVALASFTPVPVEAATAEATESAALATEAAAPTNEPTVTPTQAETEAVMTETAPTEAVATEAAPTLAETEMVAQATEATTEVGATAESAAESFADIEMALASFPVAESGIGEVDTSLGNTLMVTVCTTPGRAMRTLLPQVMNALAKESPALGTTVAALGVRMLDCGANTPLLAVAVDLATAQSYAQGGLTDSAFAASWQPQ